MMELLRNGLAFLIIVPFVLTAVLFAGFRLSGRTPVKSFRMAADSTVPFLLIATGLLLNRFHAHAWLLFAMLLLAAGIGYAVAERVKSKEFSMHRMLRSFWRMLFITMSLSYLLLLAAGAVTAAVGFVMR